MCCERKTAHKLKHFLSAYEKINKQQELELIVTIICQNYNLRIFMIIQFFRFHFQNFTREIVTSHTTLSKCTSF